METIYDHYLIEDREQLDANLLLMHQALIKILESTTKADFNTAEDSWVQFGKSYQILKALNLKKIQHDGQQINLYMRRNYF